jgi:hypothetical protein
MRRNGEFDCSSEAGSGNYSCPTEPRTFRGNVELLLVPEGKGHLLLEDCQRRLNQELNSGDFEVRGYLPNTVTRLASKMTNTEEPITFNFNLRPGMVP